MAESEESEGALTWDAAMARIDLPPQAPGQEQLMLGSLTLENYRGFQRYSLNGLARVNLLVGKNNCGKTTILEAVHFLASEGDPLVLVDIAAQRGEAVPEMEQRERARRGMRPTLAHFFLDHRFGPGSAFCISSTNDLGTAAAEVVSRSAAEDQRALFDDNDDVHAGLALWVGGPDGGGLSIPVADDGSVSYNTVMRRRRVANQDEPSRPVLSISPDSLGPLPMSRAWEHVILNGRENEVIDAMKVLEPRLTGIFFLGVDSDYRYGNRSGVYLGMEGIRQRYPLGSFGEGMRRLLAIAISLIQAQGGVLLVDEIDTGLHFSVMEDMWRLVIEAAQRSDVQVFATTHSLDCVEGLADVCRMHHRLGKHVSLQKIDPSIDHAVGLSAEELVLANRHGMEVR